jgi:predicted permease
VKWPFTRHGDVPDSVEHDIDEELSFHLSKTIDELKAGGMSDTDARAAAARRFGSLHFHRGNLVQLERQAEARIRRRAVMDIIKTSFRSAMRGTRREPTFTIGVIVLLTLGLGVNAITFGLVDRLILSGPAGVDEPHRVQRVVVHHRDSSGTEIPDFGYSYQDYRDLLTAKGLANVAGESSAPQLLGSGSTAELIRAKLVTATYFPLLGAQPLIGRFFTADESERAGERLVVLSYTLWQRRFGGDAGAIGQVVRIGSNNYTVIGIAPRHFTGSSVTRADVFLPLEAAADEMVTGDWQTSRNFGWMSSLVRLGPGTSREAAAAEATALHRAAHVEEAADRFEGRIEFAPLNAVSGITSPGYVSVAGLAAIVALLVLVIATANVANLFLARAIRRSSEMAIKLALGVGRARIVAEQAVEGAILAVAGAAVAMVIANRGGPVIQRWLFPNVDWLDSTIEVRTVLFVLTCALLGGGLAAGVPVWMAGRGDLRWLKGAGQRVVLRRTHLQAMMLVVQGALSVLLLVGAGLFVRSLTELRGVDLGLDIDRVLVVGLAPGDAPLRADLAQTLRERLARLPGIERTSQVSGTMPFVSSWATRVAIPDQGDRPEVRAGRYVQAATPEYFETVGTALVQGRRFTAADVLGAPRVAIVNQTMAKIFWPGESALGKCLRIGPDPAPPCSTIVGVVENTPRNSILERGSLLYYLPLAQAPPVVMAGASRIVVRVAGDDPRALAAVTESIRREALALEPSLRYVGVQSLAEQLAPQLLAWELGATLFSVFGALALLVAAVGLYSVVAFDVEGRRREIGLRTALGAPAASIVRMVMFGNVRVAAAGVLLGLAAAWLTAPQMQALLYGTSAHDSSVFVAAAFALLGAAMIAGVAPALRAARIDPTETLRDE